MKTELFVINLKHIWNEKDKIQQRYNLLEKMGIEVADKRDEYGTGMFYADRSLIAELTIKKIEFEIGGSSNVNLDVGTDGLLSSLERIQAAADKLAQITASTEGQFNHSCNVYMPGNAMLMFNETLLLEDHCTDALQEALNKGWRIIAACPQPDQRRPDYILGRYNPNNLVEMANLVDHRAHNAKRSVEK